MEVLVNGQIVKGVDFEKIDKEKAYETVSERFGKEAINPFTVYLTGCFLKDNDFELVSVDFTDLEDKVDLKAFEYVLKDGDVLGYDPVERARAFFQD